MDNKNQHLRHILLYYYKLIKSYVTYMVKILKVRQYQNWFSNFRSGNFDVKDAERSERPVGVHDDEILTLLESDRR